MKLETIYRVGEITVSLLGMPSSVPMLAVPRYALRRAGEDHPDVQGRLGCTRLVMALNIRQAWDLAVGGGHSRRTRLVLRASAPSVLMMLMPKSEPFIVAITLSTANQPFIIWA